MKKYTIFIALAVIFPLLTTKTILAQSTDSAAGEEETITGSSSSNTEVPNSNKNEKTKLIEESSALIRDQKFTEAIPPLNKLLELDPNNAKALLGLGMCYYLTNDFLNAETTLKKAVELDPQNAKPYAFLGLSYKALGKKEEAKNALLTFVQILKNRPTNPADTYHALIFEKLIE